VDASATTPAGRLSSTRKGCRSGRWRRGVVLRFDLLLVEPRVDAAGGVRTHDLRIKSHTNTGAFGCADGAGKRWIRLTYPHIWQFAPNFSTKTREGLRTAPSANRWCGKEPNGFFAPSHDVAELPRRHPRRVRLPDHAESRTERDSAGLATYQKPRESRAMSPKRANRRTAPLRSVVVHRHAQ
jgi:hypothetical protein